MVSVSIETKKNRNRLRFVSVHNVAFFVFCLVVFLWSVSPVASQIGRELAIPKHLQNDEEFRIPLHDLIAYGKTLFDANWTEQDGGGRPLTKGTGRALSDPSAPLVGNRSFNRISGPDA